MLNCSNWTPQVSTSHKLIVLSVTAGVALLGVLARYLRRRPDDSPRPVRRTRKFAGRRSRNSVRSPHDLISLSGSKASARSQSPGGSTVALSERLSLASGSLGAGTGGGGGGPGSHALQQLGSGDIVDANGTPLTAQQLGVMGMESLDTVINYWEDALSSLHAPHSAEQSEFCSEIQLLLDAAWSLQEQSELLFLDQRSVLFRASESAASQHQSAARRTADDRHDSDPNLDSAESFASTLDQVADLREFEEFGLAADLHQYPLYESAVRLLDDTPIPCRTMRTEQLHCASDVEYLAKLHCIRLAFQYMFRQDPLTRQWIADQGRQILTDILLLGDKDPKDFLVGYENMLLFVQDGANWSAIEEELQQRNVKSMTFYDVVVDFIILDAFKDLDGPPASVTAVVQNRFLSNGFKETALTTAVWSVLKAKRRMLKHPDGFMAHFYAIAEQVSPMMAWGFLGPDESLREVCNYFREQTMDFLQEIFNVHQCNYESVETLSADINAAMQVKVDNIRMKINMP